MSYWISVGSGRPRCFQMAYRKLRKSALRGSEVVWEVVERRCFLVRGCLLAGIWV